MRASAPPPDFGLEHAKVAALTALRAKVMKKKLLRLMPRVGAQRRTAVTTHEKKDQRPSVVVRTTPTEPRSAR